MWGFRVNVSELEEALLDFLCGKIKVEVSCCSSARRDLVCHTKGGTQAEGVKNMVLRGVFGLKRDEVRGDCIMRSFMICKEGGAWGLIQGDHWEDLGTYVGGQYWN
jgi:hypothetical protein